MRTSALAACAALTIFTAMASSYGDGTPSSRPGAIGGGVTLLPNGWKIVPAGRHVTVGHLPLAMVESPDGRSLMVATNGYDKPAISVVDPDHLYVRASLLLDHAWLGLAWHPDGTRLYVSGAANGTIHELRWNEGQLTRSVDLVIGRPFEPAIQWDDTMNPTSRNLIGGLAVSPDGRRLFAVDVLGQTFSAVDLASGRVVRTVQLPAEPYTCVVSPDGSTLFVSVWGAAGVMIFDTWSLDPIGEIATGEHPNAMAITRDGKRLFVACANTNAVWVIDVPSRRAVEQISVAMSPSAPPGSTPNHVSLSPGDRRLLVANADNNVVAVVDVSKPGASSVEGFIPTGWYPTAAMYARDGRQLFVLSGKGLTSSPNPRFVDAHATVPGGESQFVGAMLTGTLSALPNPDREALETLTRMARTVTAYSDEHRLAPAGAPAASPIPKRVGDPSPIKHVFYVIRENRTYDQVFGDLDRGNGDPTLTIFGESITPNAHALAREFGVIDNFYVDAEVSYDGHEFSMAAYATDVVQKFWPANYARRGTPFLGEGQGGKRNKYGDLAAPANGYLWDACIRQNLTVRSYGEFAHWADGTREDRLAGKLKAVASVPGLEGRINPDYAPWELEIPDNRRVDVWLKEFTTHDARGEVPALSILRLGGDHTLGTRAGRPTPRAMVAENDLALGRVVEAISKSRVWNESAIFVVEDDAQNGPDHVDAHRSIAIVISPFSRRRVVDSTMYTTSGVLRTIELILGLPPMSQYDAAATAMYNAFQATPVATPFVHIAPRVPIDEKNLPTAWGAEASLHMDFSEPDRTPERELTEIIWRSVRGPAAEVPPPVRSGFVRRADADDDR
jgi:DNA-binding beta-propeller fold protein YncE